MWKSSTSVGMTAAAMATAAVVVGRRVWTTQQSTRRRLMSGAARLDVMTRRRPANIGDTLSAVETPCLVVDLDAMEKNLRAMPKTLADRKLSHVAIRPHAKAHKCAEIGHLQLHYSNAVGLCCQKIVEAEAMFAGGIQDLLLSNEVYGQDRYERMAELAKQGAKITLIFDNEETIHQAEAVAAEAGVEFQALVDVNVGQNRCGVDSVEEAIDLAKIINRSKHLTLRGIQAYHGGAQHIRSYAEKEKVILHQVCEKAKAVRDAFVTNGLCCDVVTGGGTGTYLFEASSDVFTEVQPGSYLFNDADYARNLGQNGKFVQDWEQSLFVLSTVMSVNKSAPRAVIDAGMKAVSLDSGVPLVYSAIDSRPLPPLTYQGGGDEHGILVPAPDAPGSEIPMPVLGQKLLLTPGHCDPTSNLYDFIVGFRNGVVETVWQIGARGPGN